MDNIKKEKRKKAQRKYKLLVRARKVFKELAQDHKTGACVELSHFDEGKFRHTVERFRIPYIPKP